MGHKSKAGVSLGDLARVVAELAPPRLAEDWDNVGLQIGDPSARIQRVMTCLEVTRSTLAEARRRRAQAIVAHHPLVFRPFRTVLESRPPEQLAAELIRSNIGLVVAHTNLDSAEWGTNEVLAERLGLEVTGPLFPSAGSEVYKLTVFTPRGHESAIIDAIASAGGGQIGAYSHCTFRTPGTGTFKGDERTDPFIGSSGRLEEADEYRLEAVVPASRSGAVLEAVKRTHPYEEPAYDLYQLVSSTGPEGIGSLARPKKPITAESFARSVKRKLKLKTVRLSGPGNRVIRKVAICTGSGGSFLSRIPSTGAQAYLTGEVTYHYGVEAHQRNIAVIEVGHFESEQIVAEPFARQLLEEATLRAVGVEVFSAKNDLQPFTYY